MTPDTVRDDARALSPVLVILLLIVLTAIISIVITAFLLGLGN
ncbi:hypothetical protein ACOZ4I_16350 [Haloarcula salina]